MGVLDETKAILSPAGAWLWTEFGNSSNLYPRAPVVHLVIFPNIPAHHDPSSRAMRYKLCCVRLYNMDKHTLLLPLHTKNEYYQLNEDKFKNEDAPKNVEKQK